MKTNLNVQELPEIAQPASEEEFMSPKQLAYFRNKLMSWREELAKEATVTLNYLQKETHAEPDFADQATAETDRSFELRTRDRARKLISKIDMALQRIGEGAYGYCEETGAPIELARLEARPIATLSLEAQERHEHKERVFREKEIV